jgi:alpha-D-ribose 1-methylphosphonate 5-triphosphate synthase subunit PhnI
MAAVNTISEASRAKLLIGREWGYTFQGREGYLLAFSTIKRATKIANCIEKAEYISQSKERIIRGHKNAI